MRSSNVKRVLLLAASLLASDVAGAASKSYTGKGHASMAAGREACEQAAILEGERAAVRKAVEAISDEPFRQDRYGQILEQARDFIGKSRASGGNADPNGRCEMTVKARVDVTKLERAMQGASAGGAVIAVIVRYSVDGVLAGRVGRNELEATDIAMRSLQDRGCRTISLHEHYRIFSQKLSRRKQSVGTEDGNAVVPETETDAEAVGRLLRQLAQRFSSETVDLVLIGDVDVGVRGKDPDSARFLAEAELELSLHQISSLREYKATRVPVGGTGSSQTIAIDKALRSGVHHAVKDISEDYDDTNDVTICQALVAH